MLEIVPAATADQYRGASFLAATQLLGEDNPSDVALASAEAELRAGDVGVAIAFRIDPKVGVVKIDALVTDPSVRDRGLGRVLMRYAEEAALANGVRQAVLRSSPEAVPFYVRMGYQQTEGLSYARELSM